MGAVGGYRLVAGTAMPPLLLDDEEAVAVAVGLGTAANGTVTGIEEASVRAAGQAGTGASLPAALPGQRAALGHPAAARRPSTGRPGGADGHRHRRPRPAADQVPLHSHDGTQGTRAAEPHHLVHTGRRWYLLGWDPANDGWRTFRADRMTSPQITGPRFTPRDPPGGDAAAYVSRSVSSAPYRYQARIRLHLPAQAAAERLPPTVGHLQADGEHACILHTGAEPRRARHLRGHHRRRVRDTRPARSRRACPRPSRQAHPRWHTNDPAGSPRESPRPRARPLAHSLFKRGPVARAAARPGNAATAFARKSAAGMAMKIARGGPLDRAARRAVRRRSSTPTDRRRCRWAAR